MIHTLQEFTPNPLGVWPRWSDIPIGGELQTWLFQAHNGSRRHRNGRDRELRHSGPTWTTDH